MKIGMNASGGDTGFEVTVPAAILAATNCPNIQISLFSRQAVILPHKLTNLEWVQCLDSKDELRSALRNMSEGRLDAVITATKSERLLASCIPYLQTGIKRPGLIAPFPTRSERRISYVMDVGATAKINNPEVFLGWARLGSDFLKEQIGITNPRIGLGNIALEKGRGGPEINVIDAALQDFPGYVGFVEPRGFIDGKCDLLLKDGFGGNWMLKWTEAFSDLMFDVISKVVASTPEAYQRLIEIQQKYLSYDAHIISPLLGVKGGMIFRVHGEATPEQIAKAFDAVATRYKIE